MAGGVLSRLAWLEQAVRRLQKRLTLASGGAFPPSAHASTHVSGGTDELDVTTLGGFPGGSPVLYLDSDGTFSDPNPAGPGNEGVLMFVISGAGSVIPVGIVEGHLYVPIDCEIVEAIALADQSGDIEVDIQADSYTNYPPDGTDSITASAPVALSGADKSSDTTLTGWSTGLTAGLILRFEVLTVVDITSLTVFLRVTF